MTHKEETLMSESNVATPTANAKDTVPPFGRIPRRTTQWQRQRATSTASATR